MLLVATSDSLSWSVTPYVNGMISKAFHEHAKATHIHHAQLMVTIPIAAAHTPLTILSNHSRQRSSLQNSNDITFDMNISPFGTR